MIVRRMGPYAYALWNPHWPLPSQPVRVIWTRDALRWMVIARLESVTEGVVRLEWVSDPQPVVPPNRRQYPRYTLHWPLQVRPAHTWRRTGWHTVTEDVSAVSCRCRLPHVLEVRTAYVLTLEAPTDQRWIVTAQVVRQVPGDEAVHIVFLWVPDAAWMHWWSQRIEGRTVPLR